MLDTYPYPPVFADDDTAKANAHRRAADLQRPLTVAEADDYKAFYHAEAAFWRLHGWYAKSDGALAQAISKLDQGKHRLARNRVSNAIDMKVRAIRKLLRDAAKRRAGGHDPPAPAA